MKKNMLIVTVVILSLVLAAVIGLTVWLELHAGEPAPLPTEPTETTEPAETTEPTTVPTTTDTQPATEDTEPTVPPFSWPEDDLVDPVEPVQTQPQPTEPSETTKPTEPPATSKPTDPPATTEPTEPPTTEPTEPPTTAPQPTSGNPGGMGGPNEGEEDVLE